MWHCHCYNSGRCCGRGLIPGLGTSVCHMYIPPKMLIHILFPFQSSNGFPFRWNIKSKPLSILLMLIVANRAGSSSSPPSLCFQHSDDLPVVLRFFQAPICFLNIFWKFTCYWSRVGLQCCVNFCHMAKWFIYNTFTYTFFFIGFFVMIYHRWIYFCSCCSFFLDDLLAYLKNVSLSFQLSCLTSPPSPAKSFLPPPH